MPRRRAPYRSGPAPSRTVTHRRRPWRNLAQVPSSTFSELEPVVAKLLDRHLAAAREWFPHELVPWERACEIVPGAPWDPALGAGLSPGARSAIFVNLLTEDNLPYYTTALASAFGEDGAWGEWMWRWTAEEGRHSIVLRDWLTVSQLIDPVVMERGRMQQVSSGVAPDPWSSALGPSAPAATLVYVSLQELATRVAHFNTAKALDDTAGYEIMKRVAADENLHFLFYRDLSMGAMEVAPSEMVIAMERVVKTFNMPGTGISGYHEHTVAIADEGIYSLLIFHDNVLTPTLRSWRVEQLTGLSSEASAARDRLLAHAQRVQRIANRLEEQRLEKLSDAPASAK
jgi:acyl-[acyl-carrier-protein] desaturase